MEFSESVLHLHFLLGDIQPRDGHDEELARLGKIDIVHNLSSTVVWVLLNEHVCREHSFAKACELRLSDGQ